ncbi:carbohydrate ABC transporter permease [Paenibacillus sp. FSL R7-0297]|jgi:putative aldouronate transport system permease protein|uniref:ABC transporter permease subunit n=1 Tax=Paenibacillus phytohabitans TaxID=2654978 RepID=A0ABX1YH52_9BACL|nr:MULTISPECIES: carbohydrate ABC transporter permease [Paenibacillus]AIQ43749.1 ABC transporter permease [Paenibacillus sp. FSL R5-0912]NOU80193.1 ABC transporter permease subunit [Paenibacillus phytohabitans]OMF23301.1 ABC transporter permease [Paenibacillus sp. FSL H8-0259]
MQSTKGEKVFYGFNYLLLTLAGILCLLPLLHLASLSLSGKDAVLSGFVTLWPVEFTLSSYTMLFEGTPVVRAFGNSLLITLVGVAASMLFTIFAAYPLSRRDFYGRRTLTLAIVFTMLFTGGLIPTYLVVSSLGLVDSYAALWLPALVSTYNMMIMRSFFENIPEELVEAARIDGSGEWRLLAGIILPLSLPVLATIGLFYGVYYWNSFFNVMIYMNSPEKINLTVLIQQMVKSQAVLQELNTMNSQEVVNITPEGIKAAGIMVMVIPMLIVYPLLQRYFVKGVTIGAIKG